MATLLEIGRQIVGGKRESCPVACLGSLADAAMGWAYAATLPEGMSFAAMEMKINFLRGVRKAILTAESKVVKASWTLGYVECEVRDEQGRLVAKAASTCMKLKRE